MVQGEFGAADGQAENSHQDKSLIQSLAKINGPRVLELQQKKAKREFITLHSSLIFFSLFLFITKILSFNLKRKSNIFFWGKISLLEVARGTPAFLSTAAVRAARTKRGNHRSKAQATLAHGSPTTCKRGPLLV